MKVIHVAWQAERYGIGTFLINLIECQKKIFDDLQVGIAFHADGPCIDKYENLGIPVYSLGHNTARDIRAIPQFYKIFKRYDIVNLHNSSPWAFLAGRLAGKKIIYTFHGALGLKKKWTDILVKIFYKIVINQYCNKITFASRSSLNRYDVGIGCKPNEEEIEIFPYGTQIANIKIEKSRKNVRRDLGVDGKFVIGTAARIDPMKRIDRLIEAFAYLPRQGDFELLIVGTGDKNYQDCLINRVRSYKLEEFVHFIGYRKDIFDMINAFDIFVLPSNNEPFGLALLEAMALGIPSVVFEDGGGAVDIIGESGFVVKNPKELSDVIMNLKDDALLRESVARKVKERAQLFDIKYTAKNMYRIYTSLLDS